MTQKRLKDKRTGKWRVKDATTRHEHKTRQPVYAHWANSYDLLFSHSTAAVRGSESGRARLGVPGLVFALGRAADRQRVNAVRVAIAVAAVLVPATVTGRPNEDRTFPAPSLEQTGDMQPFCCRQTSTGEIPLLVLLMRYQHACKAYLKQEARVPCIASETLTTNGKAAFNHLRQCKQGNVTWGVCFAFASRQPPREHNLLKCQWHVDAFQNSGHSVKLSFIKHEALSIHDCTIKRAKWQIAWRSH